MFTEINWNEILQNFRIDLSKLIVSLITILLVIVIGHLFLTYLSKATARIIRNAQKMDDQVKAKSLTTSMTILRSVSRYAVYFIGFCIIVNQLGFGGILSNVVTVAGVGALVVSLGAQSIIQDILAGLFIVFERQYGVGDYVKINEHSGTVTSVAMRCTYLKSWTGEKIIIPNGKISTVINYSQDFNMAIIDVPVPYEANSSAVLKILKEVAENYYQKNRDICFEEPAVLAINGFADSSMTFSIYIKAKGRNHFRIQRDIRYLVKEKFDENGISIPYNQIVVRTES